MAKGVRRTKSKFGARLELFMVVDVQCYEGRTLDTVTQVEAWRRTARPSRVITRSTPPLPRSRRRPSGSPRSRSRRRGCTCLTLGAMLARRRRARRPGLVLDAYLLRAMDVAGWAPALREVRGPRTGEHRAFSPPAGGCLPGLPPAGCGASGAGDGRTDGRAAEGDWAVADARLARPARGQRAGRGHPAVAPGAGACCRW